MRARDCATSRRERRTPETAVMTGTWARTLMLLLSAFSVGAAADARTQPASKPYSPPPFIFIMIDAKTEAALGEFPLDRAVLAKAVDQAAAMKARAVVLNFYLDKPK